MHLYFKVSPVINFTSLPTLGNSSSGTVTVHIDDATYNPYSTWTSLTYTTSHGLLVNSGTSYTSYNSGSASSDSQTLTTISSGGPLFVLLPMLVLHQPLFRLPLAHLILSQQPLTVHQGHPVRFRM